MYERAFYSEIALFIYRYRDSACIFIKRYSIIKYAVLSGEVAVPYSRNPLYARSNSFVADMYL